MLTTVVSTGLRWLPCCCPVRSRTDRGGRSSSSRHKRSKKLGCFTRISACTSRGWPRTFSIYLWLIMTGLHPHLGPGIGELVHASVNCTGPVENDVFKLGTEGLGYYRDVGCCTLALAPLLAADASLPALPLDLFALLGLGSPEVPRYPSGPSGGASRPKNEGRKAQWELQG